MNDMANETYVRMHDTIINRVGIINQLHGYQYHHGSYAPCIIRYRLGFYEVWYFGNLLTSWRAYDMTSAESSFVEVDTLCNAVWLVRRAGKLRGL